MDRTQSEDFLARREETRPTVSNLPDAWPEFHDRVEIAAREAARITGDRPRDA